METRTQQSALLTRLLELTGEQRQALDAGDIGALQAISGLRAQIVQHAAPFIPPQCAWDPSLAELAAEVQQASETLQRDLRAGLDRVRNDLKQLSKREWVVNYIPNTPTKGRRAWNG